MKLTYYRAAALFDYDEETGTLSRKDGAGPRYARFTIADGYLDFGYRLVEADGRRFAVHKIVWLLTRGGALQARKKRVGRPKLRAKLVSEGRGSGGRRPRVKRRTAWRAGDDVHYPSIDPRSGHVGPRFKLTHQDAQGRWHLTADTECAGSA